MENPQPKKRRRARKPDGKYQGDNPVTTANEAWEPVEVMQEVSEKTVKYGVTQKVSGTSGGTAGKYSKQSRVRPTFGSVTTTTH